jgi:hypothetical protein
VSFLIFNSFRFVGGTEEIGENCNNKLTELHDYLPLRVVLSNDVG